MTQKYNRVQLIVANYINTFLAILCNMLASTVLRKGCKVGLAIHNTLKQIGDTNLAIHKTNALKVTNTEFKHKMEKMALNSSLWVQQFLTRN